MKELRPGVEKGVSWAERLLSTCNRYRYRTLGFIACFGMAGAGWDSDGGSAGIMVNYPVSETVRPVVESLRHPVLGYIGAAIGVTVMNGLILGGEENNSARANTYRSTAATLGAASVNWGVELAHQVLHPLLNEPVISAENMKDFVFALGGAALYGVCNWLDNRKQSSQS